MEGGILESQSKVELNVVIVLGEKVCKLDCGIRGSYVYIERPVSVVSADECYYFKLFKLTINSLEDDSGRWW